MRSEERWTKAFGWDHEPWAPCGPGLPVPPPAPEAAGVRAGLGSATAASATGPPAPQAAGVGAGPGPSAAASTAAPPSRKRSLDSILADPRLEREEIRGKKLVSFSSLLDVIGSEAAKRAKLQPEERLTRWASQFHWPEGSFLDSVTFRGRNGAGKFKKMVSESIVADIHSKVSCVLVSPKC
jgi:hypothetical protein